MQLGTSQFLEIYNISKNRDSKGIGPLRRFPLFEGKSFRIGDGFLKVPGELARDKEAQGVAQSFGFHTAKSSFEAALCVFPKNIGFSESRAPARREFE